MTDNEPGPLVKLFQALGLDDKLPPIETPKMIDVMPVKLQRSPDARRYDLRYEYNSMLPVEERWMCWDENSFGMTDGDVGSFRGYGGSEKRARKALLEMFAEHDEIKPRRAGNVIHSSPFEQTEYKDVTPDNSYDYE